MYTSERVFLAADELTLDQCLELASKVGNRLRGVKIHNLYDRHGPDAVGQLERAGVHRIWVDAKLHDIPNTAKLRARAIAESGAQILTVHASGGIEMMRAALGIFGSDVYAITALTSLTEEEIHLIYGQPSKAVVLHFARLAKLAGVDGVVCSPKEVGVLAKQPELKGLKFVVPGIRSAGKDKGDQERVDTPAAALKAGADYLVIGRQITQASDPVAALDELEEEISAALAPTEGG